MAFLKGDIYLGLSGAEVKLSPYGRRLTVREVQTTRTRRTLDGTLKHDVMNSKHEFVLDYRLIVPEAVDALQTIVDYNSELSLKIYYEDGVSTDYTVIIRPFSKTRLTLSLWESVSIELLEV